LWNFKYKNNIIEKIIKYMNNTYINAETIDSIKSFEETLNENYQWFDKEIIIEKKNIS